MGPSRTLAVGETEGEYIGCYLFGIEATPHSPASYHSVATSKEELYADCKDFFDELASRKIELIKNSIHSARHEQDLKVIRTTLENLRMFLDMYLASNMKEPFLKFSGIEIFLRIGVRKREKLNGVYIE